MPAIGVKQGFWHGRHVFVTGHTGFIGGWLCLWLQKLGAQVVGYSLKPPSEPNFFECANIAGGMTSIIADVTDLNVLSQAVADSEPEIVYHLAAQPLVRTAFFEPPSSERMTENISLFPYRTRGGFSIGRFS